MAKTAAERKVMEGIMKVRKLSRPVEIRNIDEGKRTAELSFSSEEPVSRYFGDEILDHSSNSVDLEFLGSGRAPLLLDHDMEKQIGVIESASIGADRKGRAVVRFGKNALAEEAFSDVRDGIKGNISVGYRILHMTLEEAGEDSGDVYRVDKWRPLEISLVSIPADMTVGIGRDSGEEYEVRVSKPSIPKEKAMGKETTSAPDAELQGRTAVPAEPKIDATKVAHDAVSADRERQKTIRAIGKAHHMTDDAESFCDDGRSVDAFRQHVLDKLGNKAGAQVIRSARPESEIGLSGKEAQQFSFCRAIAAVLENDWSGAEFEREVIQATKKSSSGRKFQGQIVIPVDVAMVRAREEVQHYQQKMLMRDLNIATGSAGGFLVGTQHMPGSFIDLLRNRMVTRRLGARVMSGLVGNIEIPRLNAGATAYWVGEGSAPTESQPTLGQVTMSPKTVGAYTEYTRKMILQATPDVEALIRDDLAKVLAIAIDTAAMAGSGSGAEPLGIINTTGIGSDDYGAGVDWDHLVDLETEVAVDNADMGSLAYCTNATLAGAMKKTPKESGYPVYLWENMRGSEPGVGEVNGYPALVSNSVPAERILFGNWSDLIIGEWGILDMLVNPYANDTSGGGRIRALQDVDVGVRHPESFSYGYT